MTIVFLLFLILSNKLKNCIILLDLLIDSKTLKNISFNNKSLFLHIWIILVIPSIAVVINSIFCSFVKLYLLYSSSNI